MFQERGWRNDGNLIQAGFKKEKKNKKKVFINLIEEKHSNDDKKAALHY